VVSAPQEGLPELRSWFASEIGVDQDEVLISPGCQAAMSGTMRALGPSGSPVVFSVPTYPGALAVARSAGLTPAPVQRRLFQYGDSSEPGAATVWQSEDSRPE